MPMFVSTYAMASGATTSTTVYARDPDHLEVTLRMRRMDEERGSRLLPRPEMASKLVAEGKYAAAMHALIWASMIAIRSREDEAWKLLNDEGVVHQLAHEAHNLELNGSRSRYEDLSLGGYGGYRQPSWLKLAERIEHFEMGVPGVHPSWGGEDFRSVREIYRSRDRAGYMPPDYDPIYGEPRTGMIKAMADQFAKLGEAARTAKSAVELATVRLPASNDLAELISDEADAPRPPLPGKRGAHLDQLAQARAAKAAQIAAFKSAAKARPRPPTLTISLEEEVVAGLQQRQLKSYRYLGFDLSKASSFTAMLTGI